MIGLPVVKCKTATRLVCAASVVMLAITIRSAAIGDETPADLSGKPAVETNDVKARRAALLIKMREMAERFEMFKRSPADRKPFEMRPNPTFRYADQPRGFVDATLWAWGESGESGRPAVVGKVEAAVNEAKQPYWQLCIASLADESVAVTFDGVQRLNSSKPGVTLHPIPNAAQPADKAPARQRQMKALVRRFTATIHALQQDSTELEKQEMRRLPSPIFRYADEPKGLRDGMIFGLTTNGTNPDMLVVIELRDSDGGDPSWMYGIVKMTDADVHVRLDSDEVWFSRRTDPRETWDFFSVRPREE